MEAKVARARLKIALALVVAAPAVFFRFGGVQLGPEAEVLVFGVAVVATAFLLAWAAEAAQVDISGSLATAVLALIAVLPEYAVDLYFSYSAGHDPTRAQFAAANMTGSNRLLIGVGWPLVAFVAFAAYRRSRKSPKATETDLSVTADEIRLPPVRRIEVGFLAAASVYAFVIPFTHTLAWYDSVVLLSLFGIYLWRVSKEQQSEPDLIGVSAALGGLPRRQRRTIVPLLFLAAAGIVLASAEPFANGLIGTGQRLGVDQFLLVQWLAPLASEAPELIVASLFAWRLRGGDALGTLLSSKVNQWTLLVGSLPLAYLLGGGGHGLPLDARQTEEFFLTSAQALLALAVVVDMRFSRREATALVALFLLQFPFPSTTLRMAFSAVYIIAAIVILTRRRAHIPPVVRTITSIKKAPELRRIHPGPDRARSGPGALPDDGLVPLRQRRAGLDVCAAAKAAPARPECDGQHRADDADDHEDHADRVNAEAARLRRHCETHDCSGGHQNEACGDSHSQHPFLGEL